MKKKKEYHAAAGGSGFDWVNRTGCTSTAELASDSRSYAVGVWSTEDMKRAQGARTYEQACKLRKIREVFRRRIGYTGSTQLSNI